MNILQIHNYYQIPGGEDVVVEAEKQMLERQGHKVVRYSRNNAELKTMKWWQKLLLPATVVFSLRTYRQVRKLIREQDIQVVHVHNTLSLISPSVYYAAVHSGVPVVQTVHNFRLLCPGAVFYRDGHVCEDCVERGLLCAVKHKCYRGSRLQTLMCVISTAVHRALGIYGKIDYICLTEFNRKKLISLKQIDPRRIAVKCQAVQNPPPFIPGQQRKNRYIYAGRLDELKGIGVLLEAWRIMGADAVQLLLCGTGPMEEQCRQSVASGQVKNVEVMGLLPNDTVRKLIAESKALILPTQWYEGFPVILAEAFASGTPVLGADLGNVADAIIPGVNGYRFDSSDPHSLIRALEQLARKPVDYKRIAEESVEKCAQEENCRQLEEIYQRLIGR